MARKWLTATWMGTKRSTQAIRHYFYTLVLYCHIWMCFEVFVYIFVIVAYELIACRGQKRAHHHWNLTLSHIVSAPFNDDFLPCLSVCPSVRIVGMYFFVIKLLLKLFLLLPRSVIVIVLEIQHTYICTDIYLCIYLLICIKRMS